MNIGVPKERRPYENRVGLTPIGVELLTQRGHRCYVERQAGIGSGFSDEDYTHAGATIVYEAQEAFGRADLVLKATRPLQAELAWLREGQIITGFLHLSSAARDKTQTLLERKVTAIAYETIQRDDGSLPVLKPMSQLAGRMAAQVAARLLQTDYGGKGILLGGVPSVPPAEVVILGAGVVGTNAAEAFLGLGAQITVLDQDLTRLQELDLHFHGKLVTMVSHAFNLERVCRYADVLVGCVLVPGARAPVLVTRDMVASMKPRSVILDIAIDHGGCVETSRPMHHGMPTFVEEGVIHYCVPNMPGAIARTATHAYQNAAWPYIQSIADMGLEAAIAADPALARGVNTYDGELKNPELAEVFESGAVTWPVG
jgi:alanine dehydrogenase